MPSTVALLGALDTKGEDFAFLRRRIEQQGCNVLLIDIGVLGEPAIPADIGRAEVALAGGERLSELVARHDRGHAMEIMARGAASLVLRLHGQGRIDAVMGAGGGGGTTVATHAMRELPLGFPKLMVSTVAATNTQPYVGISDIVMMPSVVDVAGLNRISRLIYTRAADAVCGMVRGALESTSEGDDERPVIAATMFGITTAGVTRACQRLEAAGAETLIFHANGGGRAMERLIRDGLIDAVLDFTTTELADELMGGIRSAGPHRLEAAAARGVPQLVSLGALDAVNFGAPATVPEHFAGRKLHVHNPLTTTLMRTSPEESTELGRILAGKLNASKGPVVVLLPLRGISALDAPGEPFDDPVARAALIRSLREAIDPAIVSLREIDAHINDAAFADAAADALIDLLAPRLGGRSPTAARHVEP